MQSQKQINPKYTCKGKVSYLNTKGTGGCLEDYLPVQDGKRISHELRWVSVSESFKKMK